MEAKYYRDYGHNYLILQCGQHDAAEGYQYKILTAGRIGEILPCSVRYVNGNAYYYYDISSRISLESLYRSRKMSGEQVKDFLRQINGIYEKLAGYFMEESRLVLLPEFIYYDMTSRRYIGLYYPDYRPEECGNGRALTDFLLEHTDMEDRDLAEKIYRICETAYDNAFFVEDALRILEEGEGEAAAEVQPAPVQMEDEGAYDFDDMVCDAAAGLREADRRDEKSGRKPIFYPVFAVLSLLGIGGAAAVYVMCVLTDREKLVLYGVMAVMCLCFFLCLAGIAADRKKKSQGGRSAVSEKAGDIGWDDEERMNLYGEAYGRQMPDDCAPTAAASPLDGIISRDMNLELAGYGAAARQVQRGGQSRISPVECADTSDMYGNTVFFDESADREYKLYALDRKNKNHIELKRFPYTVGKMAGCVDHVLSDDSVSRIHARFDREGERVLLTDMNSTNGTYKNGLRMQPQETVELEPGDEIRFGSLNYCYR